MSLFKEAEGQLQTSCSLDCKFLGLGEEEKTLSKFMNEWSALTFAMKHNSFICVWVNYRNTT